MQLVKLRMCQNGHNIKRAWSIDWKLKILCDNLFKYAVYILLRLHQVSIRLVQFA